MYLLLSHQNHIRTNRRVKSELISEAGVREGEASEGVCISAREVYGPPQCPPGIIPKYLCKMDVGCVTW